METQLWQLLVIGLAADPDGMRNRSHAIFSSVLGPFATAADALTVRDTIAADGKKQGVFYHTFIYPIVRP